MMYGLCNVYEGRRYQWMDVWAQRLPDDVKGAGWMCGLKGGQMTSRMLLQESS